jgi:phage gp29-like protein
VPDEKPSLTPDNQSVIDQFRIEQTIRLRYSPFPELTMEILSRQLNQFRTGELRPAARTWEIMFERDGKLSGPALKRFADTSRLPWEIEKSEDSAEADAHADALNYFYTHLTATSVLEQNDVGGANLLFRQMMTAKAHRYSVHEILLRVNNAGKRQVTAQFNHTPVWFYENRRGYLAYLPGELDWWGQKLETGKWLAAVGEGLMRPCSVAYGIKHFALRDNLLFSARFGIPGILGEFNGEKDSPGGLAFAEALKNFSNDWVTALFGGVGQGKITLIEAAKGGSGTLPFQELIESSDRLYAEMFRGGDLSSSSRGGESRGASLQDEEKTLLLEDDARWLTDTLNARVDEPIITYLFNAEPKAWLRVRVPQKPEVDKEINTLNAAGTLGIPVSMKLARERLQLPEPKAGEPLVKLASAVAVADSTKLDKMALGNSAEEAGQKFAMAVAADLLPVLKAADERLQRILTITDPALRKQKWDEAWAELEPLRKGILADPTSARVLEQISAKALADGIEGKKPTP